MKLDPEIVGSLSHVPAAPLASDLAEYWRAGLNLEKGRTDEGHLVFHHSLKSADLMAQRYNKLRAENPRELSDFITMLDSHDMRREERYSTYRTELQEDYSRYAVCVEKAREGFDMMPDSYKESVQSKYVLMALEFAQSQLSDGRSRHSKAVDDVERAVRDLGRSSPDGLRTFFHDTSSSSSLSETSTYSPSESRGGRHHSRDISDSSMKVDIGLRVPAEQSPAGGPIARQRRDSGARQSLSTEPLQDSRSLRQGLQH